MDRTVAVVGTLDTKEPEYRFLLGCLRHHGLEPVLVDISLREHDGDLRPDFTVRDVAGRAGTDAASLPGMKKADAARVMVAGAKAIAGELVRDGKAYGVMALGGANGTIMAGEIMKSLPVYLPKVIVSVVAAADPRANVGTQDIVLVNCVSDMCLNRLTARIIANAAAALAGMVRLPPAPIAGSEKRLVAATMLGLSQRCVLGVKELVELQPYEVVVFHANGIGGVALEGMVERGLVEGVLDLTLNEHVNHLVGGVFDAGPARMDAALKRGLPMVLAPGCLDLVNHWGRSIPAQFQERVFIYHNAQNTLMRTLADEALRCGCYVGEKLNRSTAPVRVLVPLEGTSANDVAGGPRAVTIDGRDGGPWHRPEVVRAFADGLRQTVRNPKVDVLELQAHLNDARFIRTVAHAFLEVMTAR